MAMRVAGLAMRAYPSEIECWLMGPDPKPRKPHENKASDSLCLDEFKTSGCYCLASGHSARQRRLCPCSVGRLALAGGGSMATICFRFFSASICSYLLFSCTAAASSRPPPLVPRGSPPSIFSAHMRSASAASFSASWSSWLSGSASRRSIRPCSSRTESSTRSPPLPEAAALPTGDFPPPAGLAAGLLCGWAGWPIFAPVRSPLSTSCFHCRTRA
mmetsp:Transcript_25550/g.58165  ORF Transcript_25550/g.58165 Transcript_25550/m.58165 type:complete len:216 (-) Transcript_25550:178-825(-)